MFKITMPRGDVRPVNFTLQGLNGCVIDFDEIYFTVKLAATRSDFVLQKRLTTGDIELMEDGSYQLIIEPEDTNHLKYGKYIVDIEVVSGDDLKQTFIGELALLDEVTHANNEAV